MAKPSQSHAIAQKIEEILQRILDGKLHIQVVSARAGKARRARPGAKARKPRGKPGRKPLPLAEKKRRERARLLEKKRALAEQLPSMRDVRMFLHEKYEGAKVTAIAKHFGLKRTAIQPLLDRGVTHQDLLLEKSGLYFLGKPMRFRKARKAPKLAPIAQNKLLKFIGDRPGATLQQMAKQFNTNYQRFIRLTRGLVEDGVLVKRGEGFALA